MLRTAAIFAIMLCGVGAVVAYGQSATGHLFPDVIAVTASSRGADVFDFAVTITSPYDTAQRYADGFRVSAGLGGTVYGERILLHDHADEQPFTRGLQGIRIPPGVHSVLVQGRDKAHGYGGKSFELALPGR
jgi:hypothetical protein